MNVPDEHHEASRLSRIWDGLIAGTPSDNEADAALLAGIHLVERSTRVPAAPPDLKVRVWSDLMRQTSPTVSVPVTPASAPNGHHPERAIPARRAALARVRISTVLALYRWVAIGVLAGFAAGFVTGLWTRAAMRVAGLLTIDRNRGLLTESDAVVGQYSVEGTLSLAMFGGLIGVAGGLLYVAVRTWLPRNGWLRALGYGALLLAVFGFIVMDPDNPDYRLFGPPWFNVFTFSVAYIMCGAVICFAADRLDRRVPRLTTERKHRWRTLAWAGALAPFAFIAFIGAMAVLFTLANLAAVFGAGPVLLLPAAAALGWLASRWRAAPDAAWRRRAGLAKYVALAAPAVLGLFLTLRSVIEILTG